MNESTIPVPPEPEPTPASAVSLASVLAAPRPETPLAVDVPTAARMLGVSARTVRREIDRGTLHAVRIGRLLRIRTAELNRYLATLEK